MKLRKIVKWSVIGIVAILIMVVGVTIIFPAALGGPTAPPLQLPPLHTATTSANAVSPDGTWIVGDGSLAGFRVKESFLAQSGTLVGRTSAIAGSLVISHNQVDSGSFQVDLSKLTMGGKQNTNFFQILNTTKDPNATLNLTNPIVFTSIPTDGQTIFSNANGTLTLHGITHPVTFTFTGRYDGATLQATGTAPVLASEWSIKSPFGLHDDDMIEFLVIMQKG